MTDQTTYESQADLARDIADPRYAESPRYRDEVAAKLRQSVDAGTISAPAQFTSYGDTIHTRTAYHEPEAMYGSANPMPGADPLMAEAAKIGSGFFEGPEAIANAMAAPHFDLDVGYQRAVADKIGRSIREGFITPDLKPVDPSKRFSR